MKAEVSPVEVRSYREDGFLVINDLLDEAELERWRAAVEEAVQDPGVSGRDLDPQQSEYYDRVFLQRVNLWKTSAAVRELVLDGRLGEAGRDPDRSGRGPPLPRSRPHQAALGQPHQLARRQPVRPLPLP